VTDAWVTNASPLILFGRIGRLDLFERLSSVIIVPDAVFDEERAGEVKDPTASTVLKWAEKRCLPNLNVPSSVEHWDLGAGESQVIAHGLNTSSWVVLDDISGRRCATAHGLAVIGSLGVVLRAKKLGVISEARPLVMKLKEAGMFLDNQTLDQGLLIIGE